MRMIRDCPAAQWFPSRYRFAIARLLAFIWAHFARPAKMECDHVILAIERDQSAIEHYIITLYIFVTITLYAGSILPRVAAPFAAAAAIQACIALGGLVVGGSPENRLKRNSFLLMTLIAAASAYFALSTSAARYVAWLFFALLTTNALAWAILRLMRNSVRKLEEQCGN